jgi:ribosomal protein L7/L12
MDPTASPKSAHVTKRLICALLAIGILAGLVVEIVTRLHTGQLPTIGDLVGGVAALWGAYVFGFYAIKGPSNTETGVLSEPSDEVKKLAVRRGSKIEAIKAYRQQTGVDLKRAKQVVERLASLGRPEA